MSLSASKTAAELIKEHSSINAQQTLRCTLLFSASLHNAHSIQPGSWKDSHEQFGNDADPI